jgi:uncharacterized protein
MSEATFTATMERIRRHCLFSGRKSVSLSFHGGEPCLVGAERFDSWCDEARRILAGVAEVRIVVQTNGTLLDGAWAEVLLKQQVQVGISMDGPKHLHDVFRIDHKGQGSYELVERGLEILRHARVPFEIFSVIPLGADPLTIHRHFLGLECNQISYLLPDFTHDTIGPIRQRYGPTPCADFLIPVFDDWWFHGTMDVCIRDFWTIARIILGGDSQTDSLGNGPLGFLVVETDGEIEGLDVLRICGEGTTKTGLNVHQADFRDIAGANAFHARMIFEGMPLPFGCRSCPERDTCAGGYVPHRYSRANGFDNPSVWCADLLRVFTHIRLRLGVPVEESAHRRIALNRKRQLTIG